MRGSPQKFIMRQMEIGISYNFRRNSLHLHVMHPTLIRFPLNVILGIFWGLIWVRNFTIATGTRATIKFQLHFVSLSPQPTHTSAFRIFVFTEPVCVYVSFLVNKMFYLWTCCNNNPTWSERGGFNAKTNQFDKSFI